MNTPPSEISGQITGQIAQNLAEFSPHIIKDPLFKQSAVLILLIPRKTCVYIVFTARPRTMNSHGGQMSFPGGKFDLHFDKNLQETALRETHEETGISPSNVAVIGRLDDLPTTSGYIISPFVGLYSGPFPVAYAPNPQEVADLVEIPLEFFLSLPKFEDKLDYEFDFRGYKAISICAKYHDPQTQKDYEVWGATAHIVAELCKICLNHVLTKTEYARPPFDLIVKYLTSQKAAKMGR